jgi:tetratricopeptide (TPR) repeat protein
VHRAWRALLLASLLLFGVASWRDSTYDFRFLEGSRAYRAGRNQEALEKFLSAIWAWIGDTASAVYHDAPAGGWPASRADQFLTTAWGGYAGAVLRSPLDTWSWSGLAEVAVLRAERRDAAGVDLAEIDRRSRGTVDPWRGVALVAADTAVELKPSGYEELDVRMRVYTSAAQLDAARDSLVRSARMMPAPSYHSWGTGQRFVKSLYDAIMVSLRAGVERAPAFERSGLHLDIARFAMEQEDLQTALVEMRAASATASTREERYHAARGNAQVLEALGHLSEAVDAWSEVLGLNFGEPSDQRQRGILESRIGRKSEACRDLRDALRSLPDDAGLRAFAAAVCESAGELETAERLLREGFVEPTDDPILARGMLEFYRRNGRAATAAGLARMWARDYPNRSDFAAWAKEFGGDQP